MVNTASSSTFNNTTSNEFCSFCIIHADW